MTRDPCPVTRRASRAFTILELMVATFVLAIMTGLLLSMFSKASDAWLSSQQEIDRQRTARTVLDLISRDLAQAINSTSAPAIHFFGYSDSMYFISIVPSQKYRGMSDMAEVGYQFDPTTGRFYRYYSPPTNTAEWNPRDDGSATAWKLPGVLTRFNYVYSSEADTLVADGIVDIQFIYHTNVNDSGFNTYLTTDVGKEFLPVVVDVSLTTMPPARWTNSGVVNYDLLTNQYARTYQATIYLNRGGN